MEHWEGCHVFDREHAKHWLDDPGTKFKHMKRIYDMHRT